MGRVKKELKPIAKHCDFCGKLFIAHSKNAKFCPEHKDLYVRERLMAESKRKLSANKELLAYVHKVEEYNRQHGTCLSYGKFEEKVGSK